MTRPSPIVYTILKMQSKLFLINLFLSSWMVLQTNSFLTFHSYVSYVHDSYKINHRVYKHKVDRWQRYQLYFQPSEDPVFIDINDDNTNLNNLKQNEVKENMSKPSNLVSTNGNRIIKPLSIDPIRFVTFNLLALILAIGSNFLGITSLFMSNINPTFWENLEINQIYPIQGFRKHVDKEDRYEFKFPANWFIDRAIILAEIREREMPKELLRRKIRGLRPDVAYQPRIDQRVTVESLESGPENISVIKSEVLDGFSLEGTLGSDPTEAATKLLRNFIAPVSSGKQFQLLHTDASIRNGRLAYMFEYIVTKPSEGLNLHSVSVIINRGRELFTFTAVSPELKWESSDKRLLLESAQSFHLVD